ncbi:MarR family winged helix-turn-helix transcriptional regulator [Lutibacter sp. A80]|uniref:MarR family winged helix-turn-helix transcriptional regulator n=1 Tax=Lutibacter sp. A80 TaxID=2918453 RepID=UPI001F068384|nr:MarR family winged helix-turn-helix transcriptional regulator [Lutibacter sp. A80]UMB61382.1 MarR family winged helix-turn-helix transcriptional regulator [Lutibacter sp. A80]
MQKEQTIDHVLRATWQAVAKMYNEQASKFDSTMSMAFVLLNIDKVNGTPSTSLGPLMGMEPTSLSRILKNMEEKGAIYREKNPEDGRGVLIKLTSYGLEKRKISKEYVIRFNETVKSQLDPEKIQNFFEVTKTINKLIAEKAIFENVHTK